MQPFRKWARKLLPGRHQQDTAGATHDADSRKPLGQPPRQQHSAGAIHDPDSGNPPGQPHRQQDSAGAIHYPDSENPPGQPRRQDKADQQHRVEAAPRHPDTAVDPLVAARAHNAEKGRLLSLPEEILLGILEHVGSDVVTLYSLRRVSRVLRRIICEPRIWRHMQAGNDFYEMRWALSEDERRRIRLNLQRDGMCDECRFWCEVQANGLLTDVVETQAPGADRLTQTGPCRFHSKSTHRPHCQPCGTHHDPHAFDYQSYDRWGVRCLGRQGAVQLCEHEHIFWADIESHVAWWRRRTPGEWQAADWEACLESFGVVCRDPSHDTQCMAEGAPTFPRARLRSNNRSQNTVVLILEWAPHSGPDVLAGSAERPMPAAALREIFGRHRGGPARVLFPSYPSVPLPEMACYSKPECRCVYYEGDDGRGRPGPPEFFRDHGGQCESFDHRYYRLTFSIDSEEVQTEKHRPGGAAGRFCLVTTYRRNIPLFSMGGGEGVNPSHAWLHAMDPDTYARQSWSHDLPLCRDAGCMNYYRRSKGFECFGWPPTIHYPCTCGEQKQEGG